MKLEHARNCLSMAKSSIFERPIRRSLIPPTLPRSLINGDVSQAIVTGLDDQVINTLPALLMLHEVTAGRIAPSNLGGGNLYAVMSGLQKTVRLGEVDLAHNACIWMIHSGNGAACWRRLRTIAVEDVGLGDTGVMTFVLWLAGHRELCAHFGNLTLASLASALMSRAVKSRDMADIAFWSTLPGSIDHLMPAFGNARTPELVAIASDEQQPVRTRHAASRAMFPSRFSTVQPWKRRSPKDRAALYEALSLPFALAWAIERDVAFGGDVLTSAGPIAWSLLRSSQTISVGADPFEPAGTELIDGVLASSFDRHTRLGKSVLSKMLREHQPWADFFARHKQASAMDCVMRSLFYLEGGILRPRLSHDLSDELYWSILQAKFASTGIASMDEGGWELLELVRNALPEINTRRRAAAINPGRNFL